MLFLLFVFEIIRRKHLKEAYALLWIITGVIFLGLSCWQRGLDYIAGVFGIYYSPAFLFLVMLVSIIFIMIQYSMVISKHTDRIKDLTQEIALLRERLQRFEEDSKNIKEQSFGQDNNE
jgi:uncharacterized membrane protein